MNLRLSRRVSAAGFTALTTAVVLMLGFGKPMVSAQDNETIGTASTEEGGHYAMVNGLKMYYEVHGAENEGIPLVLLHGALTTIDLSFGQMMPEFATNRRVIAIEEQGHGHTEDLDRPLNYEQMGEDTAALLKQIGVEQADFFGYSMGGTIAIEIALRHPKLVHKLVLASAIYNDQGLRPESHASIASLTPEMFIGSGLPELYASVAPNPDGWGTLIEKVKQLDLDYRGWKPEDLQTIKVPVLVIVGDSDEVQLEYAIEMFRLFGGGQSGDLAGLPASQLAIIPGASHVGVMAVHSSWVQMMVSDFLSLPEAPLPQ